MNRWIFAAAAAVLWPSNLPVGAQGRPRAEKPLLHRVFSSSRFDIDRILARPYDGEVPFGASGDRVWATSPQGWGFGSGVQLLYLTNRKVFDPVVKLDGVNYVVKSADYFPSHVHMTGEPGSRMTASASFTYATDDPNNPLTHPFRPEKRWTSWSSGKREDWYEVDFGRARKLVGFTLDYFDDQPGGGCAIPDGVRIETCFRGTWTNRDKSASIGEPARTTHDEFAFDDPVPAERIRLTFRHHGKDKYTGLYGFEPRFAKPDFPAPLVSAAQVQVSGDKWITQDDVLVSEITVRNTGSRAVPVSVEMRPGIDAGIGTEQAVVVSKPFELRLSVAGVDTGVAVPKPATSFYAVVPPGGQKRYRLGCGVGRLPGEATKSLNGVLASRAALRNQVDAYQGWFDSNVAAFRCSDARTQKMYFHRWYNIKKNSMYPRMGALHYRTFAEGRWTADWYANVISYGAAHQVRESRWLRDPDYAWGHVQTWADQKRPDGIYPSHITPTGQQGGQYTDWITSSAWDAQMVHPSRQILSRIAPSLAKNVDGWRKVYGWGDSPLLVVDSHWWTGMEWQPSFFAFADYRTGGEGGTDPKYQTALRRVDLTAYNYGNARAVENVYTFLGRTDLAEKYRKLAGETRDAMLEKMWDPISGWFMSLRASDDAKAPTKEIIGLYPFYFDLPPAGKGYEKAWDSALNPDLFWTKYPLASAAKDCPAYSQNGWPVGPGGSICMWNGPSWPHANSIVMTAMANTLRRYERCRVTRKSLFELFDSFTRVQYKNGDFRYPWTGEFYNGDTAEWKTAQRDYNHSTWVDPLIHDLLGLVARNDDILEIDPLAPADAWSWWCLDGQAYRGHDVTIAWDSKGGRVAPGFKGFAVYLDGKRIVEGDRPVHVLYDMNLERVVSAQVRP